jgi:class 3 adenylate cyclase
LCDNSLRARAFLFTDRGEASLRGFDDPVRIYELRWRD